MWSLPTDVHPEDIQSLQEEFSRSQSSRQTESGEEMLRLLDRPHSGYPLVGEYEGLWCSRVGDLRVIYRINEKEKEIEFIAVRARRVVYER